MQSKSENFGSLAAAEPSDDAAERPLGRSIWRGVGRACPECGKGKLFARFLEVNESCPACGEALHHHRADDAPPYFTIFIAGHAIVPAVLMVERLWTPDLWVHAALWTPLTLATCLALLPPVKGALVSLQWALRMHGFEADGPAATHDAALDRPADRGHRR